MTNRFSRRAISCALLASTAIVSPAAAWSEPLHRNWDENNVDLVQGDSRLNFEEAAIGSGKARLPLVRRNAGLFPYEWDNLVLSRSGSGSSAYTMARKPDGSTFQFTGTTSKTGDGATLSITGDPDTGYFAYEITSHDGVKYLYSDPIADEYGATNFCSYANGGTNCTLPLRRITYPDGTAIIIDVDLYTESSGFYDTRVAAVSNNFGYSIAFSYQTGGFHQNGGLSSPPASWYTRTLSELQRGGVTQASVSYSYPSSGTIDVTDPAGQVWELTNSSIKRPGESSPGFTVSGSPVTSVTRDGVTTTYSRSVSGNTVTLTKTDPLGKTTVITGDLAASQITSITDPLSRTTSFAYDTSTRLTRVTQPEGNYVDYTLDSRGNATQTQYVAKSGSGLSPITTSAVYPSSCTNALTCNEPTQTTDGRGNATDYTYDSTHGGVLTITRPAPTTGATRPQTRVSYTAVSGVYLPTGISECQTGSSCTGTSDEVKTVIGYDSYANPTSVSKGDGSGALTATTTTSYTAMGDPEYVDGPLAGSADTTRLLYDNARRLVGQIDPDPDGSGSLKNRAVRVTYNGAGLATKKELGTTVGHSDSAWASFATSQQVDIGYDGNFRPVTSKLSSGGTNYALTQTSYDSLGRSDCVAARMNPAIYGSLPSSACTLGTAGSFGNDRISQTVYDDASEPIQLKEGVGTSDAATERTLYYTNNGILASIVDGENNRTDTFIDGFDRLGKIFYPSATKGAGTSNSSDDEEFAYDANGNLTAYRNRAGSLFNFTYDALNRRTFKDRPGSEPDVTYGYDNLGRMTSASQSGTSLGFTYDALGRQTSETGQVASVSQQFDLAGRRTQLSSSNGYFITFPRLVTGETTAILDGWPNVTASFSYDDLRRRTGASYLDGSSASWSYDGISRLASLSHDFPGTTYDLTKSFSYNPASQIISETRSNDSYAYGAFANINQTTVSNGLNQLSTVGGTSASSDSNGNLTADPVTGRTYGYDSENKLTSASGGTTLNYDPLDRSASVTSSSGTRKFLYAPGDSGLPEVISEYDGSGNILSHNLWGPGPDELSISWDNVASVLRSYHADERGSIIAVGDWSGGVAINRYDEYGMPQSGNYGRFQYTGQMWLPEAGVYHYKARDYAPSGGRMLQPDPIWPASGSNPYPYTNGDPVNFTDPLGLAGSSKPNPPPQSSIEIWGSLRFWDFTSSSAIGAQPGTGNGDSGDIEATRIDPVTQTGKEIVVVGVRRALERAGIPGSIAQQFVQPYNSNFAVITDLKILKTLHWTKQFSTHSRGAWEARIPGSHFALKVYIGDKDSGGNNTIAIVEPTSSFIHYLQWAYYRLGFAVGALNAQMYCSSSGQC